MKSRPKDTPPGLPVHSFRRAGFLQVFLALIVVVLSLLLAERVRIRHEPLETGAGNPVHAARLLSGTLKAPVRITYIRSDLLARRNQEPEKIENWLASLASRSEGLIRYDSMDSKTWPGGPEKAGLTPGTLGIVEKEERRQVTVYSGLKFEYLGRSTVIPFLLESASLSSLVTRTILSLVSDKPFVVTIMVADKGKSLENDFSLLASGLKAAAFRIVSIEPGTPIPEDTTLLCVLGGMGSGNDPVLQKTSQSIGNWLTEAGPKRILAAVRGIEISADEEIRARKGGIGALGELFERLGVRVQESLVLDRSALTVPVERATGAGDQDLAYFLYPHWIIARPENARLGEALAETVGGLDLFWSSPLEASGATGTEFKPLVATGKNAWTMSNAFVLSPGPIESYETERDQHTGRYILGALVASDDSGLVPIYRENEPGSPEGVQNSDSGNQPGSTNAIKNQQTGSKRIRIAVIGSPDAAGDLSAMTGSSRNIPFFLRLVEYLALPDRDGSGFPDPSIIGSEAGRDRTFKIGADDGSSLAAVRRSYFITLLVVPSVLFLVAAVLRPLRSRNKTGISEMERGSL